MSAKDDRPEIGTLLKELGRDGDGGDPLFPTRPGKPKARGGEEEKAPASGGAAQATIVRVVAPASRMRGWWLAMGVLVIVAPLVALGLASALRAPIVELRPALPGSGDAVSTNAAGAGVPSIVIVREVDAGAATNDDAGAKQQDADAGAAMKRGEQRSKTAEPKTAAEPAMDAADAGKIEAPAAPKHEPGSDIW
jgi:hypothetical protein